MCSLYHCVFLLPQSIVCQLTFTLCSLEKISPSEENTPGSLNAICKTGDKTFGRSFCWKVEIKIFIKIYVHSLNIRNTDTVAYLGCTMCSQCCSTRLQWAQWDGYLDDSEETKPTVVGGLTSSPQSLVVSVTVCLCNDYRVQLWG